MVSQLQEKEELQGSKDFMLLQASITVGGQNKTPKHKVQEDDLPRPSLSSIPQMKLGTYVQGSMTKTKMNLSLGQQAARSKQAWELIVKSKMLMAQCKNKYI